MSFKKKTVSDKCGRHGNHREDSCPHKGVRCYNCIRFGHFSKACRQPKRKQDYHQKHRAKATMVTASCTSSDQCALSDPILSNLYSITEKPTSDLEENVTVDNNVVKFVVDTAASISVMGECQVQMIY